MEIIQSCDGGFDFGLNVLPTLLLFLLPENYKREERMSGAIAEASTTTNTRSNMKCEAIMERDQAWAGIISTSTSHHVAPHFFVAH